jgi:DNA-binding NarL/FixJ family response regulator
MGKSQRIKVLIVDDHAVVRQGLRTFLGMLPDIQIVGEAASGAEAVEAAGKAGPDITRKILSGIAGAGQVQPPQEQLTGREAELLGCLARGLSNKEIAAELFIAEKTVKTHISNILSKLDLSDCTRAAVYAVKHGYQ